MNKIKVGDTVRILDNSAHPLYPLLTKDKLAIVERIEEGDIGEELLVKELEEPFWNDSWWISITSVEKVSSETNTVEEKEDKRKIVIPFTLEQFEDAINRIKAEYEAGDLVLVGLFDIETLEYYYEKAKEYEEKTNPTYK